MSPTEFSNYIKQRAMQQQQIHHTQTGHAVPNANVHLGPIGPVSPARSLSPNPLTVAITNSTTSNCGQVSSSNCVPNDPYFFSSAITNSMNTNLYSPQQYRRNTLFDSNTIINNSANVFANTGPANGIYSNNFDSVGSGGKYSPYLDANNFYNHQQQQQPPNNMNSAGHSLGSISPNTHPQNLLASFNGAIGGNGIIGHGLPNTNTGNNGTTLAVPMSSPGTITAASDNNAPTNAPGSKHLDGMNTFYSNPGQYQHLLVAN